MGDGQFERFSSARRTRRYKKSQDDSESENFTDKPARPTSINLQPGESNPKTNVWQNEADIRAEDSDGVTREALADITKSSRELQNLEQTALRPKLRDRDRDRARSYIDPGHIAEASRGRSITPTVPRVAKGPSACSQYLQHGAPTVHITGTRPRSEFIPEIRIYASASAPMAPKHRPEHDFADEGFEETQSLMSETPSQGTGSSDVVDSLARQKPSGAETTDSSLGSVESKEDIKPDSLIAPLQSNVTVVTVNATKPATQTSTPRTVIRSRSQTDRPSVRPGFGSRADTGRSGPSILTNKNDAKERTARTASAERSVRKPSAFNNNPVERSNSRTSLRSSRSSLASATSVNTVRKMPPATKTPTANRLAGYTNAIKNLTSNLRNGSGPHTNQRKSSSLLQKTGVSSRSISSSGSSIGPPSRSFNKENTAKNGTTTVRRSLSSSSGGGASFMRPTAASVAKDAPPPKPRTSIRTSFK